MYAQQLNQRKGAHVLGQTNTGDVDKFVSFVIQSRQVLEGGAISVLCHVHFT